MNATPSNGTLTPLPATKPATLPSAPKTTADVKFGVPPSEDRPRRKRSGTGADPHDAPAPIVMKLPFEAGMVSSMTRTIIRILCNGQHPIIRSQDAKCAYFISCEAHKLYETLDKAVADGWTCVQENTGMFAMICPEHEIKATQLIIDLQPPLVLSA